MNRNSEIDSHLLDAHDLFREKIMISRMYDLLAHQCQRKFDVIMRLNLANERYCKKMLWLITLCYGIYPSPSKHCEEQ
jgi:hypothetical protein